MRPLTASRASILAAGCNAWLADDAAWIDRPDAGAIAGTEKHDLMAAEVDGHEAVGGEGARSAVETCRPLLTHLALRGACHAEVSMAWYPADDDAEVVGEGLGRGAYSAVADPTAVFGTADVVVLCPDGSAIVADYKSWAPGQEPPDAREQLRTLALLVSRAYSVDTVEVRTGLMGETEARWTDVETLDYFGLEAVARDLQERLARPIGPPVPGGHCRWCPHRAACPVAELACDDLAPPEPPHRLSLRITSDSHAAWTLAALKLVEQRAAEVKRALLAYVDERGGITLADGKIYSARPLAVERPDLGVPGALEEIRAAGADSAIGYSTSWSAIEGAIGKPAARVLRDALRDLGAIKVTERPDYRARRP
jgi:hypothetical protein